MSLSEVHGGDVMHAAESSAPPYVLAKQHGSDLRLKLDAEDAE